jgi:hypothetical protein
VFSDFCFCDFATSGHEALETILKCHFFLSFIVPQSLVINLLLVSLKERRRDKLYLKFKLAPDWIRIKLIYHYLGTRNQAVLAGLGTTIMHLLEKKGEKDCG